MRRVGKGEEMKKKILQSDRWPKPKGPYSVALSFNHLLFISGQGPAYADTGEIVKGDFNEHARVVLRICKRFWKMRFSLEHVLKTTVLERHERFSG
jgi:2-iminobutanoate/2-iminopropanoate deaminase